MESIKILQNIFTIKVRILLLFFVWSFLIENKPAEVTSVLSQTPKNAKPIKQDFM